MAKERVQRILAQAGVGSRRACEQLIAAGRVTVNGQPIQLGDKADPQSDQIRLDGRVIEIASPIYVALYKPRNVISSTVKQGDAPIITDLVPIEARLYPVGRLDRQSEGLILLTNDGELTNHLTHPRYQHEKEYRILVAQQPTQEQLEAWRSGIQIEDGFKTAPARVWQEKTHGKGAWLRVVLHEGHKRQLRRVAAQLGLAVVRLIRVRIGPLHLGNLKKGQWRHLTPDEVASLKAGRPPKAAR